MLSRISDRSILFKTGEKASVQRAGSVFTDIELIRPIRYGVKDSALRLVPMPLDMPIKRFFDMSNDTTEVAEVTPAIIPAKLTAMSGDFALQLGSLTYSGKARIHDLAMGVKRFCPTRNWTCPPRQIRLTLPMISITSYSR